MSWDSSCYVTERSLNEIPEPELCLRAVKVATDRPPSLSVGGTDVPPDCEVGSRGDLPFIPMMKLDGNWNRLLYSRM